MPDMIEVQIDSVRVHLMTPQRLVVLKQLNSDRYLPIWVGPYEAEAITISLQEVEVARPLTHDLLKNLFTAFNARVLRVDIGIESPAEGDVVAHPAQARNLHGFVPRQHERGHVVEIDAPDLAARDARMGGDQAGRAVDAHAGLRRRHRQEAGFQRHLGDGDDAVAAHGAVALVVHEEHAEVGAGRDRRGEEAAVHVGVAARLPHERGAQAVAALPHPAPLASAELSPDGSRLLTSTRDGAVRIWDLSDGRACASN